MAGHAGVGRGQPGMRSAGNRCVAIAAVNSEPAYMMLMTEWDRLLRSVSLPGIVSDHRNNPNRQQQQRANAGRSGERCVHEQVGSGREDCHSGARAAAPANSDDAPTTQIRFAGSLMWFGLLFGPARRVSLGRGLTSQSRPGMSDNRLAGQVVSRRSRSFFAQTSSTRAS